MAIRIQRNDAGNCITFIGSTSPAYWNACLSAQINESDSSRVDIINDIRSANDPETQYEFYAQSYTDFADKDGNVFTSAQEMVDYINANANVLGLSSTGVDMTGETINFRLDDTSTTILTDFGYQFAVNSIKAVGDADGTIHIYPILSNTPDVGTEFTDRKHFSKLLHTSVSINGVAATGGLNDVVNQLNELFTVGAFTSVVVNDPYSTIVADVSGTTTSTTIIGNGVDPVGDDVYGNTFANANLNGFLTTESINEAGEYFTFDIRNAGIYGFGLVHTDASYLNGYYTGTSSNANPDNFAVINNSHAGYQFSHWFHNNYNGSWTTFGADSGYIQGPGWTNYSTKFEALDEWLAGDPIKIKVGLDENGFIAISSLKDDGVTWVLHARSDYPIADGAAFRLGIKVGNTTERVYTQPKVHYISSAPTMNFRYIESPDGYYNFPLFATQEEADYYELTVSGSNNGSHTHTYDDDPTNTTWYMPSTSNQMNYGLTPVEDGVTTFESNPINWTEIPSQTNADLVPPAFTAATLTVDELVSINYQTQPAGTSYTTTFSGLEGILGTLIDGGSGMLTGTAPEVAQDNVANPSDTYTIQVIRTNSYGSSTGNLTLVVNNLTAPTVTIASFTHIAGSTALVDSTTLGDGSAVTVDDVVADGNRIVFSNTWLQTNIRDNLQSGDKAFIGLARVSPSPTWSSIDTPDFQYGWQFEYLNGGTSLYVRKILNGSIVSNVTYSNFTNDLVFYHDYSVSGYLMSNFPNGGAGTGVATPTYTNNEYQLPNGNDLTFVVASVGNTMPISASGVSENANPVVSTNMTSWSSALDFSGSSERAAQVTQDSNRIPMKMNGQASLITGSPTSGYTSSNTSARPWATACVFKIDGNNSNQHIWNLGEGAGDNDDNIYLRVDANQNLYFGWGRSGALNECRIMTAISSAFWYAVYIGHDGRRWAASGATASNLATTFDIRVMSSHDGFASSQDKGTYLDWNQASSTTGARMDRNFTGEMSIGGRGANRNFHGKVASYVTTTLRRNQPMPSTAEIEMMITDPMQWLQDYKVGNAFRLPWQGSDAGFNFSINDGSSAYSTQVWLMGDGSSDSYSNMIRNQVHPSDQNYTKLNLISMVSNDIENVTISGLS